MFAGTILDLLRTVNSIIQALMSRIIEEIILSTFCQYEDRT
jgi:hypothetical protein